MRQNIYILPDFITENILSMVDLPTSDGIAIATSSEASAFFVAGCFAFLTNEAIEIEIAKLDVNEELVSYVHPRPVISAFNSAIQEQLQQNKIVCTPFFFGKLSENIQHWNHDSKFHDKLLELYQGMPLLFFIPKKLEEYIQEHEPTTIRISRNNAVRHMMLESNYFARVGIKLSN